MSEIKDPPNTTLDPKLRSLLDDASETGRGNYIYCASCSHVLTTSDQRIEVNGSHDHYCTNPHGFEFHLGCFAEALGCDISGDAYAADSWFMGFAWRLAACAECHTHLGWYFSSASASASDGADGTSAYFYGLILDRIQEET